MTNTDLLGRSGIAGRIECVADPIARKWTATDSHPFNSGIGNPASEYKYSCAYRRCERKLYVRNVLGCVSDSKKIQDERNQYASYPPLP